MVLTQTSRKESVERAIIDQLVWDSSVDESRIRVEVLDGIAVLSGSVPSFFDRQHAEIDAVNTPGVKRVDNRIVISYPGAPPASSDAEIRDRIRSVLAWDAGIDAARIDVSVTAGIVILRGSVDLHWKKLRTAELAAGIAGVTGINNEIAVIPSHAESDEAIARVIMATLERCTSTDINAVDLEVSRGAVHLSGTVPDRETRRSAERIASLTRGVTHVTNNLIIL